MKYTKLIRTVNPDTPEPAIEPAIIDEAIRIIRAGGVVAFPTTSLYGLGADAYSPAAIEKVRAIKARPSQKPILLLIKDQKDVSFLAEQVTPVAERLMSIFWPGALTLVMDAGKNCPPYLLSDTNKIGLRVPTHPVAVNLVNQLGTPITGTSANISGRPAIWQPDQLPAAFGENKPDLIIDAGVLKGGIGSTVVDVTPSPPVILRSGSIPADKIFAALADL